MGNLINGFVFLTVLMILFHGAGLISDSPNGIILSGIMSIVSSDADEQGSSIYDSLLVSEIITLIEVLAAAGVIVTALLYKQISIAIKTGIALYLFNSIWDMVQITIIIGSYTNIWIAILITLPIIYAYMLILAEWFTGGVA